MEILLHCLVLDPHSPPSSNALTAPHQVPVTQRNLFHMRWTSHADLNVGVILNIRTLSTPEYTCNGIFYMDTEEYNPVEYMVAQGSKKLAESNLQVLKNLYITSAVVYGFTLLGLVLRRPSNYMPFIIFQLPAIFFLMLIRLSGTPVYFPNQKNPKQLKLVRAGEDLRTDWILTYYFDGVYITYFLDISMVLFNTNYVWYLYAVIPLFCFYLFVNAMKTWILPMYNKSGK